MYWKCVNFCQIGSKIEFLWRRKAFQPSCEPTSGRLNWLSQISAKNQLYFCLWFLYLKTFQTIVEIFFQKILFSGFLSIDSEVRTNSHLKNQLMDTKDEGSTTGNGIRQTKVKWTSDGSQSYRTNDRQMISAIDVGLEVRVSGLHKNPDLF